MSSDKQEASPERRREEIKALARREGYHLIRWYTDEGISGNATEKRHDFQRMIGDSAKGDSGAVEKVVIRVDKRRMGRKHRYTLRGGEIHMKVNNLGVTARRRRSHSERYEMKSGALAAGFLPVGLRLS